jgi:hypothetical protein
VQDLQGTTDNPPPAPVAIGLIMSYGLAGMLLFTGLIGLLFWVAVGDRVGLGTTILGLLVLGATVIAGRGSRTGRAFIGLLTGILTVAGVIYMFKGPTSAIFPSIMVVVISAGTFALLFLPEKSKRFYAEA